MIYWFIVIVYRNGKLSSAGEVSQPHAFNDDMIVLIGLRYFGRPGKQGISNGTLEVSLEMASWSADVANINEE